MTNASKNDQAWEILFNELNILQIIEEQGYFEISSSVINRYREARLMTKFDYSSTLPEIFKKNNLGILPNSRGSYIISHFRLFHNFETSHSPLITIEFPKHIESINYNTISSESTAINCAYIAGILSDFTGEPNLYPTINGRMSSSIFNFTIETDTGPLPVSVNNAQIEIDAGYEGAEAIYLIEAKNVLSDDFLIRQLYYPFRLWSNKSTKQVHPIFLTCTNGIFHLREYTFDNVCVYNSIRLSREKRYTFSGESIRIEDIKEILRNNSCVLESAIPFPQANAFERLINLCELLDASGSLSRSFITRNYDFDIRQTNYYTDAGRYLGLIDKCNDNGDVQYYLTPIGQKLFELSIAQRKLSYIRHILSHTVFRNVLICYFETGTIPDKETIVEIMKSARLYKVQSDSTYYRRASTIAQWIKWILEQIET
jgi:hypothetical protein